jgi:hypothetical protein
LELKKLFKTADEFLASVAAGDVRTIELSEVAGWVVPADPIKRHKRHDVLGLTDDRSGVRLTTVEGEEFVLPVTGSWKTEAFSNQTDYKERHFVRVLDGNTEYRYLINMTYYR